MAGPLVSAVIPAYNRPRRTQRAIASVADQTYDPIELLVVDDGSDPPLEPDLTIPDGRFERGTVLTHGTNRGANAARNTGIDRATGEYVAFLDSDDEWRPEKTRRQVDQLESSDAYRASYTGVKQLDADGDLNGIQHATEEGDLRNRLLRGNVVGTFSSVVVSRDAIESVGRPDPDLPNWQDWEWFLRLSGQVAFGALADPLTVRHNDGGQISDAFEKKRDESGPVLERRIREFAPTERAARIGLAYLDYQLGQAALSARRYAEARRHFLGAVRTAPLEPDFYTSLVCAGRHYPFLQLAKRRIIRVWNTG